VTDLDGQPGAEVVVLSNAGWTGESRVTVGRIVAAVPSDDTPERYVWRELAALDDARSIWALGAPHAAATDLDRDGRAELAVTGTYPTAFLRVWRAEGARWVTHFAQDLSAAVDDTHGLLTGDLDADGDAEVVLLGACGHLGQHLVRVYDTWATDGFADLALQGPVHGALADLDGVAPPELVLYETWGCNERRAAPTRGLRVFRHDPAARAMRPVAARITTGGTREFGLVAALDLEQPRPGLRQRLALCRLHREGLRVQAQRGQRAGSRKRFGPHCVIPPLVNSRTQRPSHSEGKACCTKGWRAICASSSSMPRPGRSGRS
jgi:hypothetical protein